MPSSNTSGSVRYYFYKHDNIPTAVKDKLVTLAYETAKNLEPETILSRSSLADGSVPHSPTLHNTTFRDGKYIEGPKGRHATISFKNADQVLKNVHVTSHGYTAGKDNFTFVEATHSDEKPDVTKRKRGRPVWPADNQLREYKL